MMTRRQASTIILAGAAAAAAPSLAAQLPNQQFVTFAQTVGYPKL